MMLSLAQIRQALAGGRQAHLEKLPLNANVNEAVPLWPKMWVQKKGTSIRVRESAPKSAVIFPVAINPTTITTFTLRSRANVNSDVANETITPDLNDPAFVLRWLSMPFRVGADLWVFNSSATTAVTLDVWFYFNDDLEGC